MTRTTLICTLLALSSSACSAPAFEVGAAQGEDGVVVEETGSEGGTLDGGSEAGEVSASDTGSMAVDTATADTGSAFDTAPPPVTEWSGLLPASGGALTFEGAAWGLDVETPFVPSYVRWEGVPSIVGGCASSGSLTLFVDGVVVTNLNSPSVGAKISIDSKDKGFAWPAGTKSGKAHRYEVKLRGVTDPNCATDPPKVDVKRDGSAKLYLAK